MLKMERASALTAPRACSPSLQARWMLAVVLLALPLAAVSGQVQFFYNQTEISCLFDNDCNINWFCDRPSRGALKGTCAQCWKCCLFADLYKDCPDSCNCVEGSQCTDPSDCGQGLFCSISNPLDVPRCKKCDSCIIDSQSIFGTCDASCPSGPVSQSSQAANPQYLNHFMFLSFSAAEISPNARNPYTGTLALADVKRWVTKQDFQGPQVGDIVKALDTSGADPMLMGAFVASIISNTPLTLICPTLPPIDSATPLTPVVYSGCPCNATMNPATFACPAGHICSRRAYHSLPRVYKAAQPTAEELLALCIPCVTGMYCPQGTFAQNESDLTEFDCPQGAYCPGSATKLTCPAGSYCLAGLAEPVTCDYQYLLNNNPYMDLPTEPHTVVRRIRNDGDPMRGNICPEGAFKPNTRCPAGHYCPSVAEQYICPRGHHCKGQNVAPVKCPALTSCPEGTGKPGFSWIAFLIAGLIVLALPIVWYILRFLDPSSRVSKKGVVPEVRGGLTKSTAFAEQTSRTRQERRAQLEGMDLDFLNHKTALKFRGLQPVKAQVHIYFENLGMALKDGKVILQGVTGYFAPGKLQAVMGPSGSGKTTLLNIIAGRVGNSVTVTGQILVNGGHLPFSKLKKNISGFVPQDDIVHEDLSVRENLYYNADLLLSHSHTSSSTRAAIVNDVLDMMLLVHIQHFRVGSVEKRGISGGQRKRVNIGLELVAQPSILFLDEPTSGLDSTASSDILKSLADMANLGMNIVAVIHQPRFSSCMLFDQVLLLGHGGQTVYNGHPGVAVLYFDRGLSFCLPKNENPADVLMDVIGGKIIRIDKEGNVDHDFKPSNLPKWWKNNGVVWLSELERLNPQLSRLDLIMDAETLQSINDAFLSCTQGDGDGRVSVDELLQIFNELDQPIDKEDAVLLMRFVHNVHKSDGDGETPDEQLTISRQEVIDSLKRMVDKKAAELQIDPLDRFSSLEARYVFPKVDITSAKTAEPCKSVARMTRLPPEELASFVRKASLSERDDGDGGGDGDGPVRDSAMDRDNTDGAMCVGVDAEEVDHLQNSPLPGQAVPIGEGTTMQNGPKLLSQTPQRCVPSLLFSPTQNRRRVTAPPGLSPQCPTTPPVSVGRATMSPRANDSPQYDAIWDHRGRTTVKVCRKLDDAFLKDPAYLSPSSIGSTPAPPHDATPASSEGVPSPTLPFFPRMSLASVWSPRAQGGPSPRVNGWTQRQLTPPMAGSPGPVGEATDPQAATTLKEATTPLGEGTAPFPPLMDVDGSARLDADNPNLVLGPNVTIDSDSSYAPLNAWGVRALGPLSTEPPSSSTQAATTTPIKKSLKPLHMTYSLGRNVPDSFNHASPTGKRKARRGNANPGVEKSGRSRRNSAALENEDELLAEAVLGSLLQKSGALTKHGQHVGAGKSFTGGRGSVMAQSRMLSVAGTSYGGRGSLTHTQGGATGTAEITVAGSGRTHSILLGRNTSVARLSVARLSRALFGQFYPGSSELTELEEEIAKRKYPGVFVQLLVLLQRQAVKYMRSFWPLRVIDILLLVCAAFIIGFVQGTGWGLSSVPSNWVMSMTCLGVLSTVTHLRTFSTNFVLLIRESNSGISLSAYFLTQNILDLCWVFLAPALFLAPYYYLTLPRAAFAPFYIAAFEVCWWSSGMSYLVSTALPPQTVLMTGVFIALILGAFVQGLTPSIASARGTALEYFMGISYNRWAMELMTVEESMHYEDSSRSTIITLFAGIGLCGMDTLLITGDGDDSGALTPAEAISFLQVQRNFSYEYCNSFNLEAHLAMFFLGLGFRILAFLFLTYGKKSQY